MKTFVSWSGELSRQVAELLRTLLENVLQTTEVWFSPDDIDKGSIWFADISRELSETSVGILCLTPENLKAPWVLFEAGALSKGLNDSRRVCPLLVRLGPTDLDAPLSQFNATLPTKPDMLKLIQTVNKHDTENPIAPERVERAFEKWWQDFERGLESILQDFQPTEEPQERSVEEMTAEILQICRLLQKSVQSQTERATRPLRPYLSASDLAEAQREFAFAKGARQAQLDVHEKEQLLAKLARSENLPEVLEVHQQVQRLLQAAKRREDKTEDQEAG